MTLTRHVYAEELHVATDRLVLGAFAKVDGETQRWGSVPSLLEQLADTSKVNDGSAGGGKPKSKPTINAGIVGLLDEIPTTCRRQIRDLTGIATWASGTAQLLRAATKATADTSDQEEFAPWLTQLQGWRASARQELHLDDARRMWVRGVACTECGATNARQHGGDGQARQTPALAVIWQEPAQQAHDDEAWLCVAIECQACGKRWDR